MRRRVAVALAAGLLAVAAGALVLSLDRVAEQRAVARVCDAARAEQYAKALELSEGRTGPEAEGRVAAECRCWALLAREREGECVALLEELLEAPEAEGWVPDPALAERMVRARRAAGRLEAAAALARRASRAHPDETGLLELDLAMRSTLHGEETALAELEAELEEGDGRLALRVVLARAYYRRGDSKSALRVLGDRLPPPDAPHFRGWVHERTRALGALGRGEALRALYDEWRRAGGDPALLRAHYALRVSFSQLEDPEASQLELLTGALAHADELGPGLEESLYVRLISHLQARGERERALEVYRRASQRFELESLSENALSRSAREGPASAGAGRGREAPATLAFELPPGAVAGTLHVAPPTRAPSDAPYRSHRLAAGEAVQVERRASVFPLRWVFHDGEGRTRASGTVWPAAGETRTVAIRPGEPAEPPGRELPERAPADGRRRVFTLVLDAADWRLAQYLRTRGDLPVLDALLERGHRAVLESRPPITAAAMEKLVWPMRRRHVSFLGLVHRLGLELGGLASVGRNPLDFLSAALPQGESLFETVGAGERVAANMLFSHGKIDAGQHAQLVGPKGRRRPAQPIQAFRSLSAEERRLVPDSLLEHASFGDLVRTMASEFDAAETLAREGEVDLLLLRVEPLDILTHSLYSEVAEAGQDDGERDLYAAYRYIDRRLADVHGALDADDVLVVMSDHGIRTAMEHSVDAMFVAVGGDVPQGRAEGRPAFRGVARALAGLAGVETDWPATGIAAFAEGEGASIARRP